VISFSERRSVKGDYVLHALVKCILNDLTQDVGNRSLDLLGDALLNIRFRISNILLVPVLKDTAVAFLV